MHNGHFWCSQFRDYFISSYDLLTKQLPSILRPYQSEEVNKVLDAISDMDEQGTVAHNMIAVEQTLLNMFAMTLYHMFEQHMFRFIREEVYPQKWAKSWLGKEDELGKENMKKLKSVRWDCYSTKKNLTPFKLNLNWQDIKQELKDVIDVDVSHFKSATILKEHRLLANTVKHAEGYSCEKLRTENSSLFVSPFDSFSEESVKVESPVFSPLSGEDIYVRETDITKYLANLKRFWMELGAEVFGHCLRKVELGSGTVAIHEDPCSESFVVLHMFTDPHTKEEGTALFGPFDIDVLFVCLEREAKNHNWNQDEFSKACKNLKDIFIEKGY